MWKRIFKLNDSMIVSINMEALNSIDYFKCMQHTGQRPVTHNTAPSRRIRWLYAYPTN